MVQGGIGSPGLATDFAVLASVFIALILVAARLFPDLVQ
jgi:hypothetical protein